MITDLLPNGSHPRKTRPTHEAKAAIPAYVEGRTVDPSRLRDRPRRTSHPGDHGRNSAMTRVSLSWLHRRDSPPPGPPCKPATGSRSDFGTACTTTKVYEVVRQFTAVPPCEVGDCFVIPYNRPLGLNAAVDPVEILDNACVKQLRLGRTEFLLDNLDTARGIDFARQARFKRTCHLLAPRRRAIVISLCYRVPVAISSSQSASRVNRRSSSISALGRR